MNKDELLEAIRDADPDSALGGATLARVRTKAELYDEAKELEIEGRSNMDKRELADAIVEARSQ